MSTVVNNIQDKVNINIRDTSTNSVTAANRLSAISQATQELMAEFGFDHQNRTYELNFFDTIHYYNITADVPSLFEPVDLRRKEGDHTETFQRKSAREIANEIDLGHTENSFAIERKDLAQYLVVNFNPKYSATILESCENTANGSWSLDTTNSDATNFTIDEVEFKAGNASFNFDIDVSQSSNNRATLETSAARTIADLSTFEDLGSVVLWIYIPVKDYINSFTVYLGTDSTNYWSGAATSASDVSGNAWVSGWNRIRVDWEDMTKTGSPTSTAVDYMRFDMNYATAQGDDTDFRIDDIKIVRPEKLDFHYESTYIGRSSTAANISEFSSVNDIPFYSNTYDHFDNPISHKAAAILFRSMGLYNDAEREEQEWRKQMNDLKKRLPASHIKESKSFRPLGIRFSKK